jgi:hypothetical protein
MIYIRTFYKYIIYIISISFLSFLLCTAFISCAGLTSKQNLWEGFKDGKLRVIVNYSPSYDEFENENVIIEKLAYAAKSRTTLILVSYIRLNFPNISQSENSDQIIQKTEEAIESVKLISKSDDSITFRGIYETNVNILFDYLTSISKHEAKEAKFE